VQINGVGQDFFQTMGIPILQGRGFTAQDTANSPKVAVINQALAKRFFPKGDAIGRRFEADAEDVDAPATIVGIAADTRYADLRSDTPPTFYISHKQQLAAGRRVVEIRTAADPGSVLNEVRAAVAAEDRDLPLIDVRTMEQQVASTIGQERIFARLTSGFGLLALGLAAIGVYGVLSYNVSRRTSEIGIRLALGAQAGAVRWMVLRESLLLLGIGLAVGLPVTLGLTRVIQAQLFGLSGTDPLTIAGAVLVVGAMTLVAAWLPARRASRVDPMVALRCE
jgi:predicted permease